MPGTSGVLSPFGKIDGLYFNDSREPDNYMFNFKQDLDKIMENEGVEYVKIEADNKNDYYRILNDLCKFNKDAIKVSGTSREKFEVIVEKTEDFGDTADGKEDNNEGNE